MTELFKCDRCGSTVFEANGWATSSVVTLCTVDPSGDFNEMGEDIDLSVQEYEYEDDSLWCHQCHKEFSKTLIFNACEEEEAERND